MGILTSLKNQNAFILGVETMSASPKFQRAGSLALFGQSLISKAIYSAITIHYSLQCSPGCLSWDLPNPIKPGSSSCQNVEQSHNSHFAAWLAVAMGMLALPRTQPCRSPGCAGRRRFRTASVSWCDRCALTISRGSHKSIKVTTPGSQGTCFRNCKC